jgi:acyl-CoA dehydrogenase
MPVGSGDLGPPTFRADMRQLACDIFRPFAAEADRSAELPAELLQSPGLWRIVGTSLPLRYGGGWPLGDSGSTWIDSAGAPAMQSMIYEECGFADAPIFLSLPGPSLASLIVGALGSPAQQKRFFAGLADSRNPRWAAFALSEPGAGSDVANIQTTAVEKADHFVLNGTKWFIGNGARAHWTVVFATTNPKLRQFGLKAFLIERGTPGFRARRILPTMGFRCMRIAELSFEDCRVPKECQLCSATPRAGEAFTAAMATFHNFRPLIAALAVGVARAVLESLESYAKANGARHSQAAAWRRKFERMKELAAHLEAVRLLAYESSLRAGQGRDNSALASLAKASAAEVAMRIGAEALEMAGPAGIGAGLPLERLFRNLKAMDLLEGTGDIQRLNAVRDVLARGLEPLLATTYEEAQASETFRTQSHTNGALRAE